MDQNQKTHPSKNEIDRIAFYIWKNVKDWPYQVTIALCSEIIGKVSEEKRNGR